MINRIYLDLFKKSLKEVFTYKKLYNILIIIIIIIGLAIIYVINNLLLLINIESTITILSQYREYRLLQYLIEYSKNNYLSILLFFCVYIVFSILFLILNNYLNSLLRYFKKVYIFKKENTYSKMIKIEKEIKLMVKNKFIISSIIGLACLPLGAYYCVEYSINIEYILYFAVILVIVKMILDITAIIKAINKLNLEETYEKDIKDIYFSYDGAISDAIEVFYNVVLFGILFPLMLSIIVHISFSINELIYNSMVNKYMYIKAYENIIELKKYPNIFIEPTELYKKLGFFGLMGIGKSEVLNGIKIIKKVMPYILFILISNTTIMPIILEIKYSRKIENKNIAKNLIKKYCYTTIVLLVFQIMINILFSNGDMKELLSMNTVNIILYGFTLERVYFKKKKKEENNFKFP